MDVIKRRIIVCYIFGNMKQELKLISIYGNHKIYQQLNFIVINIFHHNIKDWYQSQAYHNPHYRQKSYAYHNPHEREQSHSYYNPKEWE